MDSVSRTGAPTRLGRPFNRAMHVFNGSGFVGRSEGRGGFVFRQIAYPYLHGQYWTVVVKRLNWGLIHTVFFCSCALKYVARILCGTIVRRDKKLRLFILSQED